MRALSLTFFIITALSIITSCGNKPAAPFITTWDTTQEGFTESNQVKIGTNQRLTYDYTIDWGDGKTDKQVIGGITHTYDNPVFTPSQSPVNFLTCCLLI